MPFFAFMKGNDWKNALLILNQFFTEYMLMIFLFYSNQPTVSKYFVTMSILVTQLCHFHLRKKINSKTSFLDVENSRESGKFVTVVYRKPTFTCVHALFESFLPSPHKFSMFYTLVCRSFTLCSN